MTAISVIPAAGGEAIQLGPVQMRILEDGRTTGHRLGVGEITIAAHADGPPQHRHARHDEGFYVVSGTARFTVADTTYDAPAGTFVMIPPGAPHTFANPAGEPAVLLNTFTPDLYVQYFRDLRDMIAAGEPLTPDSSAAVMSRYAHRSRHRFRRGDLMTTSTTCTVALADVGPVDVAVSDYGDGPPFLLAARRRRPRHRDRVRRTARDEPRRAGHRAHPSRLRRHRPARRPDQHPGPGRRCTSRSSTSSSSTDVTVIGNSIGGWIAAEMALLASPRVSRAVLVDAVGIEVPGHPIADFFSLTMDQVFALSFHDPEPFRIDPATLPPAAQAIAAGNRAALATYAGAAMSDPTLAGRLAHLRLPTLVPDPGLS